MWFDDNKSAGKRLFIDVRGMSSRSGSRSNVRLRAKGEKENRTTMLIVVPLLILAFLVVIGFILKKAGEALYSQNDKYKIVYLDIKGGKILSPQLIEEYTHIHEGMNLFGFDAKKARIDVLQRAPLRSMTITRRLPDTVKIDVVERDPVARFGNKSGLLVADREGHVFILRSGRPELPVLLGYKEETLKPAMVIEGPALAALEALDAGNDPRLLLRVDSIDVSREEHLELSVPYGSTVWTVKLAWKGMGSGAPESRKELLAKLSLIMQTLQSPQSKGHTKMDATLEGGRVYVQ
jgi:hypothetical protein